MSCEFSQGLDPGTTFVLGWLAGQFIVAAAGYAGYGSALKSQARRLAHPEHSIISDPSRDLLFSGPPKMSLEQLLPSEMK